MLFADVTPVQPAAEGVSQTFEKWNVVLQNSFNQAFHNVIELRRASSRWSSCWSSAISSPA